MAWSPFIVGRRQPVAFAESSEHKRGVWGIFSWAQGRHSCFHGTDIIALRPVEFIDIRLPSWDLESERAIVVAQTYGQSATERFIACRLWLSFFICLGVRAESSQEKNKHERKHEKKINRTSAWGMFYDIAIGIFIKKDFKNALKSFDEIMMKTCEIIRPGRANPKKHKINVSSM